MMRKLSPSSFVAGVICGILLAGAWMFRNSITLELAPFAAPAATTTAPVSASSGAVSVQNQPAGDSVLVNSVTVPPPGVWVAVREMNSADLSNVLGAARVAGPRSGVSVPLLRATKPGRPYAVLLYRDDNGGAFDPAVNSVYVDFGTGERVVAYFKTTE